MVGDRPGGYAIEFGGELAAAAALTRHRNRQHGASHRNAPVHSPTDLAAMHRMTVQAASACPAARRFVWRLFS